MSKTKHDENLQDFLKELLDTEHDDVPTGNMLQARWLSVFRNNLLKRDRQLTNLLEEYIKQCIKRVRTNNFFKKTIFWVFIALLVMLTVAVAVVFWKTDMSNITISSVVALLSVAGTYLGSLISIFRIMSKYLFPIDELKDTIEMIKVLTDKDTHLQEIFWEDESKKR